MDDNITQILNSCSEKTLAITTRLREIVKDVEPSFKEEGKIGWRAIVYKKRKIVCSILPHKQYVNIFFYGGAEIPDTYNVLQGNGVKLRHIKVHELGDINAGILTHYIKIAVALENGK